MKTPTIERFDRTAEGYLKWWAPVLAPASAKLVARVGSMDPRLPAGEPRDILDLGCGTGNLIFEAARNWPGARLVGLDGSTGMLDVVRREAAALPPQVRERLSFVHAYADALPLPDASLDLVMSAFVVQQVLDRPAVLREVARVLRPGGFVAIYGWLVDWDFAGDKAMDEEMAAAGVAKPENKEPRAGHYTSPRQAADELRAAGFRRVAPRPDALAHQWTADGYLEYRTTVRDLDHFQAMSEPKREAVIAAIRRRLATLSEADRVDRSKIMSIVARKA